ncbi:hypothetical protein [Tenacibaculum aiptasiae]|uniref:hypothetical protein n=1 Tax=Tenacibaculum aiptasiae TaxID=426481 RepID=UPI003B5AA0F8
MMLLKYKRPKKFTVRKKVKKFLLIPILHRGKLHWLSNVKLEKAFNGYRMMIISIQKS